MICKIQSAIPLYLYRGGWCVLSAPRCVRWLECVLGSVYSFMA